MPPSCPFDLSHLRCRLHVDPLHLALGQVLPSIGADIRQSTPLVHAKITDTDFDIQSVIVVPVHPSLCEVVIQHVLMGILAALDL